MSIMLDRRKRYDNWHNRLQWTDFIVYSIVSVEM